MWGERKPSAGFSKGWGGEGEASPGAPPPPLQRDPGRGCPIPSLIFVLSVVRHTSGSVGSSVRDQMTLKLINDWLSGPLRGQGADPQTKLNMASWRWAHPR